MDPFAISAAVGSVIAGLGLAMFALRRNAARRAAEPWEVVFELRLPSKWAAELTSQTLENTGVRSRIVPKGPFWNCCVTKRIESDRSQIERTCRNLNQIAASRGGGCVAHRMTRGDRREVFEH